MPRNWLIVDCEATCWENDPDQRAKSEIIEIGCVLFAPDRRQVLETFQSFVRPVAHPLLSDFCTALTTIRQRDVDAAPAFAQAAESLRARLLEGRPTVFASWGDYDRLALLAECKRHRVRWPFGKKSVNVKQLFADWKRCRPCGLGQALTMMGMTFDGTPHRGIDDARQIARICARLPDL
jgi:inhibitor of KinA sporulation pathway (predicted exonuclease)